MFGDGVLEALQGFFDRVGHGYVGVFFWVVPIYEQSVVLSAIWVDGDVVLLLEHIDEVGGIGVGEELDAKVVYSEGEGGGKGRMGPKAGGIFHRYVPMGLEVAYKAFVGNDAGFLESIHTLYDIYVDVASWVSNGEEGLLDGRLMGNLLEMDPNVPEVGRQVIEVVVDDVCGDLAGPFVSVGYDGVKVDLEVQ